MIQFPEHFFEIKLLDLAIPILTLFALVVAYWQLKDIRKHRTIEFTYQLYRDFFNYLNDEKNKDLKSWLFGGKVPNIDRDKIGDLLEQFEAVWSLQSKNLVDDDVAYDLLSYYILKASTAVEPTASEYIEELKQSEKICLHGYTDDLYVGYRALVSQMGSRKGDLKEKAGSVMKYRVKRG